MKDPVIIEREDLLRWGRDIADRAVSDTLTELGIKKKLLRPEMSQNQAEKLVGASHLRKAMDSGRVRWRKEQPGTKLGRVFINKQDVQKLLNNPTK